MTIEITKENIPISINSNIITKEEIQNELDQNPFGKYLVLEENGNIIGYIYYSDIYERLEINQFKIDLFHRNCGKGKKLLKKLIDTVDKNITLEVREDNFPAICVYKQLGFVEKAIRKNYYGNKNGLLMERVK